MGVTLEQIYKEALELPDESKASLAEQLVAYLASHMDPDLQRQHLDIVRRRRDELLSGAVMMHTSRRPGY
jgi:putative addiction module component